MRNLSYPASVYSVEVDLADRSLIIRTSNKKYYKKWRVPELDVASLPLEAAALSWSHANSTLLVSYRKPRAVLKVSPEGRPCRPGGMESLEFERVRVKKAFFAELA